MIYNYILPAMTHLRYFSPIISKANSKNIKNRIYLSRYNGKYNSVPRHINFIKKYASDNNVELTFDKNFSGVTFQIEGDDDKILKSKNETRVSITYMTDFSLSYKNYIDNVDNVIFPSLYFANKYNTHTNKNLYFGSPKYDIKIFKKEVLEKYNLVNNQKKALIIYPRNRDVNKINLNLIYDYLKKMGYFIIVKSRGKDPAKNNLRGDAYVEDISWFPHTTMELIEASDLIVNFSSTAIKESIMLEKPVINFDIKPFEKPLSELYDFNFCQNYKTDFSKNDIEKSILYIEKNNFNNEFKKAKDKYLFQRFTCVDKIIKEFS